MPNLDQCVGAEDLLDLYQRINEDLDRHQSDYIFLNDDRTSGGELETVIDQLESAFPSLQKFGDQYLVLQDLSIMRRLTSLGALRVRNSLSAANTLKLNRFINSLKEVGSKAWNTMAKYSSISFSYGNQITNIAKFYILQEEEERKKIRKQIVKSKSACNFRSAEKETEHANYISNTLIEKNVENSIEQLFEKLSGGNNHALTH